MKIELELFATLEVKQKVLTRQKAYNGNEKQEFMMQRERVNHREVKEESQ